MNRANIFIALGLMAIASGSFSQTSGYYPSPTGFVNDFEHDFTDPQVKALNDAVKQFLSETLKDDSLKGIEFAIITVSPAMYGDEKEISAYATKIGDKWGVGAKAPHRGIIIAYSKKLRKIGIVTGIGLDKLLPAETCHTIINEKMADEFRKGDPYQALMVAIKSIAQNFGILMAVI